VKAENNAKKRLLVHESSRIHANKNGVGSESETPVSSNTMQEIITRDGVRRIGIIVVVAVVCLVAFYPFSPAGRYRRQLKEADKCMNMVADALVGDARYTNIAVASCTEYGDRIFLGIAGRVASDKHLEELHGIVRSIDQPFSLQWLVEVYSGASSGENVTMDMNSVDRKIPWQILQTNPPPVTPERFVE
jgi:hypothetical protein